MGWFLNLVKPKIKSEGIEHQHAENLWKSCPSCSEMVYSKEWEAAYYVCPICNFHERVPASIRIKMLADGRPRYLKFPEISDDPLNFKGQVTYKEKLKSERKKTQLEDAAVSAEINIDGQKAIVFVMDFNFIGGSMGRYVGTAFAECAKNAIAKKIPMIAVTASGGARMQEGILALMQMPKTVMYCEKMRQNNIPYVVVLSDPTTGGVIASFAMLGDITFAEPNALIGFTGPRVIEETMQIKLDQGFQRSEFQLKHGFIDYIVQRADLKKEVAKVISFLMYGKKIRKKVK